MTICMKLAEWLSFALCFGVVSYIDFILVISFSGTCVLERALLDLSVYSKVNFGFIKLGEYNVNKSRNPH